MLVRVVWEFEAEVEEFDDKFVDKEGLAKDLTKREVEWMLQDGQFSADDFEYSVVLKGE